MKKLTLSLAAIAILLAAAYAGSSLLMQSRVPTLATTNDSATEALLQKGAYIAKSADCFACHSAPGGKDYAGGLAMQTPIGAIYSTNITPDKETGIGNYTLQDFSAAVKHGVRADGAPLYPAMPYASYVIMPDEDIAAMYAYFMNAVEPVHQANTDSTIPPVMNWRWPLAYWQLLFAPERKFVADPSGDQQLNRGKYLVEGPGHCGACHTPRGIAYQEKALSDDGNEIFLSGAVIDGWRAKSLRSEARGLLSWTAEEIIEFLKTGRTHKVSAFGAMADVIEHSTQHLTTEDLNGIAQYLKSLSPAPNKALSLTAKQDTTSAEMLSGTYTSRGALLYNEHCVTCHRSDGMGVARIFPALNDNSIVYAEKPQSIIQITLEGGKMPATPSDSMAFAMPAFKHLGDQDIADIINFIRNSWHNQAPEINAYDVAEIRQFVQKKAPNSGVEGVQK